MLKDRRWVYKMKALAHYGGKCTCCGEIEPRFLQFDHINNDGGERRKNNIGERFLAGWLVQHDYPNDFQILCANCNHAKRYGVCPHKVSHARQEK